jgi:periplasmic divalent cation tolerance protein
MEFDFLAMGSFRVEFSNATIMREAYAILGQVGAKGQRGDIRVGENVRFFRLCYDQRQGRGAGDRTRACANVHEKVTSIYRWDGQLHEDTETVLIVKTRSELLDPLIAKVTAMHSYDCPCIVALPIHSGNPAFLEWIETETREAGS